MGSLYLWPDDHTDIMCFFGNYITFITHDPIPRGFLEPVATSLWNIKGGGICLCRKSLHLVHFLHAPEPGAVNMN